MYERFVILITRYHAQLRVNNPLITLFDFQIFHYFFLQSPDRDDL